MPKLRYRDQRSTIHGTAEIVIELDEADFGKNASVEAVLETADRLLGHLRTWKFDPANRLGQVIEGIEGPSPNPHQPAPASR